VYRPEKLVVFFMAGGVAPERREESLLRSVLSGKSAGELELSIVVELSTEAGGMSNCEDRVWLASGVRMYESTYKH